MHNRADGGVRRLISLMAAVLVIAGGLSLVVESPAEAAVVRSFAPRYRTNDRGDIIAIGNTLVSCLTSVATCAAARSQQTANNNDFVGGYVDVDSVAATLNSSQATLTIPTGATVLWAGLYWIGSGTNTDATRASVRLAGPSGVYTNLTGTVTTGVAATTGGFPYAGFVDVTSLVQTSGVYTVGGVSTVVGQSNARGGWSIVTVVRDSTQPLRNLSVFDGYAEINSSAADSVVTTNISGFLTPTTGTVTARIGAVTSEGDAGLTGDAFRFNGVNVTDSLNPSTNFWNSTITRLGTRISAKNPDYVNQMGFDVDYVNAPAGAITNSQTSATLTFTTGGESYEPVALFTAIDIFEPNVTATKTVAKVGAGTKLNPGDQVEYTITLNSTGNEAASNVQLLDAIPTGATYVPGSITVGTTTTNGVSVTDATGDDTGEYRAASRSVALRTGTGASSSAGGSLSPSATSVVKFRVTVDSPAAAGLNLSNQASVSYFSPTTATAYATSTDDPNQPGSSNSTDFDVNDRPVANAITTTTPEDTSTTISLVAATSDADGDTLTFTNTAIPAGQGTLTCVAGSCTFVPASNFNGIVTFSYTATDPGGLSATNTVTITVSAVNDPPIAVNDSYTINEDTIGTFVVTANDTDIETANTSLAVTGFTQGSKGTVACSGSTCTYTPQANVNGTDTFTYLVSDGNGGTATATVSVTITPVQDPPAATGVSVVTNEDQPISIDVLDGDSDPDGDAVRLLSFTQPVGGAGVGTVTCTTNTGPCLFTPAANYNGSTSFTYTITDTPGAGGRTSTATINVTVQPVNDRPVAVADAATTAEDTSVSVDVLANDSDIDGGALRIPSFTQPANGTVTCGPVNGTGPCVYTPKANFNGTDSFTYEVADGNGGQSTGVVTITVTPVNDPPVALNDAATVAEDTTATINVLANDSDLDGNPLQITSANPTAAHGTVTCSTTSCSYTPALDYNGPDTFTYTISDGQGGTATATVTLTVTPSNDPPVANPDALTVAEDVAGTVDVLANDTDPDGIAGRTVSGFTQPTNGTVSCTTAGLCTYTPRLNANGTDSFTYTVTDNAGATSSTTVSVTVTPVNDAPIAGNDTAVTDEDTAVVIDVASSDSDVDGDTLRYTVLTQPANGTVTCAVLAGTCTYTPNANFNGADSFTYQVRDRLTGGLTADATVTINVTGVNDSPIATPNTFATNEDSTVVFDPRLGDTDPDGDPLVIAVTTQPPNGAVLCSSVSCAYAPNANFNGTDTFTYTISDGRGGTASALITINVAPVNDRPVAQNDSATTNEDAPVDIGVTANDTDIDGNPLTVTVTGIPVGGSVSCAAGVCRFTPAPNFNGTASFTYTVDDGTGTANSTSAPATVSILVQAVNDNPVAVADTFTTNEDSAVPIDLVANDTDVDGDTLSIISVTRPANGTVNCDDLATGGLCRYIPNANFNGTDTFSYTISDGNGGSATATVTVTVTGVNDPPVANPDSASTDEDVPVVVDVRSGDTDIDNDVLRITAVSTPNRGTVFCGTLPSLGTCTYTPNPNTNGTDSFTYTISDGNGGTATATVTVLVRAANDPPVAVDDSATTAEDTPAIVDVLAAPGADTDVDGDTLTIVGNSNGSNGAVTCSTTQCTYTPNANFNGNDSFTYTITDGNGANSSATVNVTVTAVNDPPQLVNWSVNTNEDTATGSVNVLTGSTDVDGDAVTLTSFTNPSNGSVSCNLTTGTCVYTPNANYNGTDSFTVTGSDPSGATSTATITVTVTPVNDRPTPQNDTATTPEDTPITVAVLANDTDPDVGDTVSVVADDAPRLTANGSVLCSVSACVYTPNLNFNGPDTFTYDAVDSAGARVTARVNVTVTPVNDPPTPGDGTGTTPEDTPLQVPVSFVLANDTDLDGDTLYAIFFTPPDPATGSVSCTISGPPETPYLPSDICTFTPAPNYNGTTSFTYTVRDRPIGDPTGFDRAATITVIVGPDNDAPTAVNDTASTPEDTPVTVAVRANDTDTDDPAGSLAVVPQNRATAHGRVVCDAASCVYTPNLNYNGPDSFTYDIVDPSGATSTATVSVTVTAVNDRPTPEDGTGTTPEDTPLAVPVAFVLSNDSDPDGDTLYAISFTQPDPATGSVVCASSGPPATPYLPSDICTFTPAPNYNGTTTFTYTVSDRPIGAPGALTAVATVTVIVGPVNDAPVAFADSASTTEDAPVTFNVLTNDTDVDGGALQIAAGQYTQPANGTVVCTPAGACTYTPNADFNGTDSFTYVVSDGNGGSATATVSLTVSGVNDPPIAAAIAGDTDEDQPVTVDVVAGTFDADGDTVDFDGIVAQPANGTVTCSTAGSCTYTPNANFNGTDSFTFSVRDNQGGTATGTATIRVNSLNDSPVANADAPASIIEDSGALLIPVLANDTDADLDTLVIVSNTAASKGTAVCSPTSCTYTPFADAFGTDTFTYTISDGNGGVSTGTVTITIDAVNDPPQASPVSVTLAEDTTSTVNVLAGATDVEGNTLTFVVTTPPTNGTLVCIGSACSYTPGLNVNGTDSYVVTISDGNGGSVTRTITLNITPVNDAPVAAVTTAATNEDTPVTLNVLTGSSDVDTDDVVSFVSATNGAQGTVSCTTAGVCTYTPSANANGTDSFTYTIRDIDGAEVITTVTVTIAPVNDDPAVQPQTITVDEDGSATIDLTAGTGDVDGDTLTYTVETAPTKGTFTCDPSNVCTYVPGPDATGADSVTIRVSDGNGGSVVVTHSIVINAINDSPVAVADPANTPEDVAVTIPVLANDTDVDGDTLRIVTPAPTAANGTVTCSATACVYTPNANFHGTDTFTYTISDRAIGGLTSSATVTVVVDSVNDAPVSLPQSATTPEDTPIVLDPLEGVSDVDGDPLIVNVVGADGGTVDCGTLPGVGPCTFTPPLNASGTFTVSVTISDGTVTIVHTITVNVTPVNDPAVAPPVAVTIDEDTTASLDLLAGVSDPDGGAVTLESVTQPANGTVTCDLPAGTCTYTPRLNFSGPTDTFTYTVVDAAGARTTSTVTITINPLNDAPTPGSGSGTTPEDTPLFVDVAYILANDTDPDPGDTFEAISFVQPQHGTAVCFGPSPYAPSTICRYTPEANFVGTDTFTYIVRDAAGLTGQATITVIVTAVNDAPVVVDENVVVVEDTPRTIDVLANDSDIDGGPLQIVQITQPQHGTVSCGTLPGVGPCVYTPNQNSNEADSFTYVVSDGSLTTSGLVSITIDPVNDPPQVFGRSVTTSEDTAIVVDALAGAIDPDGTPVTFGSVTQPAAGTGTVNCTPTGSCTFTPFPEFSGTTSFDITVLGAGGQSATATITVTVLAVNDAPIGVTDAVTISEDAAPTVIDVLGNDSDPEGTPLTITAFTNGGIGTVVCSTGPAPVPTCTYTPLPNSSGPDSFSYTLSDGVNSVVVVVNVTVVPVPDAPVAVDDSATVDEDTAVVIPVLTNDTDADGGTPGQVSIITFPTSGTVRINPDSGEIEYTPAPNSNGTFTFVYQACDVDGLCDTATVTVVVLAVPDNPIAEDASAVTERDSAIEIDVLDQASDADGDLVVSSLALLGQPSNGQAVIDPATNRIVYTPDAGFVGSDSFPFQVCDSRAVCVTATVRVDVVVPSIAPAAGNDTSTVDENASVTIPVLVNDAAPGRPIDSSTVTVGAAPANGTATVDPATGAIVYAPAPDFVGTDTFTYVVCEQTGPPSGEGQPTPPPKCSTAVVTVSVLAVVPPTTQPPTTLPPTTAPPTTEPPVIQPPVTQPPVIVPPITNPVTSPTAPSGGALPSTGTDSSSSLPLAALLLAVGCGLVLVARRRRHRS